MNWFGRAGAAATDAELFEADLVAFVRQHYPRLIRLAGLICRDVIDSEDAVQAGLERAWRSRASLREAEKLAPWLDRIVVREAIRLGRDKRSVLGRLLSDPEAIEIGDSGRDDEIGSSVATRAALRHAFEALPAAQRAVVALHLYQGYSLAETAELIGAPLETVRSRLRLARERLRFQLTEVQG